MSKPILAAFQRFFAGQCSVDVPLAELLTEENARAVGLWRCAPGHLQLVGFHAAVDMPDEVRKDFASATESVPLAETGLGIVKAVVTRQPAVATREATGLGSSASWLTRFEAGQSVAMPVCHRGHVVGVLAISTVRILNADDAAWQLLENLAGEIGPLLDADRGVR